MFEEYSHLVILGSGAVLALLLVAWLDWRLRSLPESVGQPRREFLLVGMIASAAALLSAYGLYALWLKKPSVDLLALNRAFRFEPKTWRAGQEVELEFRFSGGEIQGQLLTMLVLKDELGKEVARLEKSLGHAGEGWETLRFRYPVKASGRYQFDVYTPHFIEDVKLLKDPTGI